jgi:hypothetical protein
MSMNPSGPIAGVATGAEVAAVRLPATAQRPPASGPCPGRSVGRHDDASAG